MRRLHALVAACALVAAAALPSAAFAHGGDYKGPVQKMPGTGGGGGGGGGGDTTGGGGSTDAPGNVTAWETWWANNKDEHLRIGQRMRDRQTTPSATGRDARSKELLLAERSEKDAIVRGEIVPVLLEALADESSEIRTAAAVALGKSGDPRAAKPLEERALGDDAKDVRESAMLGLGLLGREAAIPFLDDQLRDRKNPSRLRGFAAFALGLVGGQDAAAALARCVESPDGAELSRATPDLRASIYFGLGLSGHADALPALRSAAAKEDDENVRSFAVLGLGKLRDRESLDAVLRLFLHKHGGLRRAAVIAAGRIAERKDGAALAALLDRLRNDGDPLVRHFAAVALGGLADASVLPAMRKLLADADAMDRPFLALSLGIAKDAPSFPAIRRLLDGEKSASHRGAYSIALGLGGDSAARESLEREVMSKGSPWPPAYAALAIGMIPCDASASILRMRLEDENDPRVRANLALALAMMDDQAGEAYLRRTLASDGTIYERAGAAVSLGHIRKARNVPALMDAFRKKKDHEFVRALAVVALGVIADPEDVPRLAAFKVDGDYSVSHDALNEAMSIY
ncbi:MAG: hypothetical protein HMLKMBBP_01731 [Planctomycetes bacterium]|nr:hypothetical protein [Planctomycetota bacterium]